MLRIVLAAGIIFLPPFTVGAQTIADDPYAVPRSAVTGWPMFYKPLKIHPRDQLYYAMGWCRTNHYYYTAADLVDIDTLDELAVRGQVVERRDGAIIAWFDGADRPVAVHVHPEATGLVVRGPLKRSALKPDEFVRFVGRIDSAGHTDAPVARIEVCPPPAEDSRSTIKPGADAPIVGKVVQVRRDALAVMVESDTVRRVIAKLDPKTSVQLESSELRWAVPGSRLAVEGRVYRADNRIPADQVFATMLEIRLPGSNDFAPTDLAGPEHPATRKRTASLATAGTSPGESPANGTIGE
ncbi:MAG TPA: hypothetical protein VG713_22270 [Pirellulales bacterium]|nr:hypothetical protein [Pirellulales bacterium]